MALDVPPGQYVATTEKNTTSETNRERFMHDQEFATANMERWFADLFNETVVHPETGLELPVIDTSALKERFSERFRFADSGKAPKPIILKYLKDHFENIKCVSKDQIERGDYTPKSLLYWPDSSEAATDVQTVKNAQFLLEPLDLTRLADIERDFTETEDPELAAINWPEAMFALRLLHPSHGDAQRIAGDLMVRDKATGELQKPDTATMRSYGFYRQEHTAADVQADRGVLTAWKRHFPNLYEQGIIQDGDLREAQADIKQPNRKGGVSYNNVVHNLRSRYAEGHSMRRVADQLGLVLNAGGVLEATFTVFEKADLGVKSSGTTNRLDYYVNQSDVGITVIDYEGLVGERRTEESFSDYVGRVEMLQKGMTSLYTDIVPAMPDATLFQELPATEQKALASTALWLEYTGRRLDLMSFAEEFGTHGLRTFAQLEGDEARSTQILEFAKAYPAEATALVTYYSALLDYVAEAELFSNDPETAANISQNILGRAKGDLLRIIAETDLDAVQRLLDVYIPEAKLYVARLQEAAHERLDSTVATAMPKLVKEQIRGLSKRSYTSEPADFQQEIATGLEAAFTRDSTRFYVETNEKDEVVFGDRFDDLVDVHTGRRVKYFGSVLADPAHSGIGRIRIAETLDTELASGETMFAHCDPENPVSGLYIEHGFVATKTLNAAGKFSFEIWRSATSTEQFVSKSLEPDELVAAMQNPKPRQTFQVRKVVSGDTFPELGDGLALTRNFKRGNERYAVFEKLPESLQAEFVPPQTEV